MKCLIALALVACVAHANPLVPADTPEVAAAKAAHFAEYNRAAAAAGAPGYAYPYAAYPYSYGYPYAYPYSTYAAPVVTPEGYLADTPEVAAAKAAHFAEHAKAGGAVPYYGYPYAYGAYPYYSGYPYNVPVVTPSGFLADTPEVAAAKAAHFAEVAKAKAIA
ncbi:cuticle protein 2-like [Homalodisca vitripennis]|nr:cuticle protein 2-like [Homalodisca vitripennis]